MTGKLWPRREEARPHPEREALKHQIHALKMAGDAFREAGKEEALEKVHRAIRARECALEGRRDEEAQEIRRRAPDREETIELLTWARKLYDEWGKEDRAVALGRMAEALRARPEDRPHREEGAGELVHHEIEVFGIACHAFEEAERPDAADIMRRAAHVRKLGLHGQVGGKVDAPSREEEIELLSQAAGLWMEWGFEEKARTVGHLARKLRAQHGEMRGKAGDGEIDELRHRLGELEHAIRKLHEELERLRRSEF
jgi:hypothetical protein